MIILNNSVISLQNGYDTFLELCTMYLSNLKDCLNSFNHNIFKILLNCFVVHSCNSCSFIIQIIFSFLSLPFSIFLPILQLYYVLVPSAHLNVLRTITHHFSKLHFFLYECPFCNVFFNLKILSSVCMLKLLFCKNFGTNQGLTRLKRKLVKVI